jgi:phage FluMu protein Com
MNVDRRLLEEVAALLTRLLRHDNLSHADAALLTELETALHDHGTCPECKSYETVEKTVEFGLKTRALQVRCKKCGKVLKHTSI